MSTTTLPTETPEKRSGRHQVNVGHLVMGIAFLGIVAVWGFVQADLVEGSDIRWLLPLPWVLAGIAGLTATAVGGSRRWSTRQVGWVTPAAAQDTNDTNDTADITDTPDDSEEEQR